MIRLISSASTARFYFTFGKFLRSETVQLHQDWWPFAVTTMVGIEVYDRHITAAWSERNPCL
jgi:hypothetical protein